MKIAVLSNKPHAESIHVIETLFGKGYFDVIQGQKEEVAIKPSPEGVFQILEELKLVYLKLVLVKLNLLKLQLKELIILIKRYFILLEKFMKMELLLLEKIVMFKEC